MFSLLKNLAKLYLSSAVFAGLTTLLQDRIGHVVTHYRRREEYMRLQGYRMY